MYIHMESLFNNVPKTDLNKVNKYEERYWVTNTLKSAVVKVVADSKDLYITSKA